MGRKKRESGKHLKPRCRGWHQRPHASPREEGSEATERAGSQGGRAKQEGSETADRMGGPIRKKAERAERKEREEEIAKLPYTHTAASEGKPIVSLIDRKTVYSS